MTEADSDHRPSVGIDQVDVDGEPPEFDLTPRPAASPGGRGTTRRRWIAAAALVVVAGTAGFLVTKALGSATDYFYRVDEAVANRAELGTSRFRIQGTVADEPTSVTVTDNTQRIDFTLTANGVTVPVVYTGSDPPALFDACEPVVIVGNWDSVGPDATFEGTQIIIKHSETYEADHAERLRSDPDCQRTP